MSNTKRIVIAAGVVGVGMLCLCVGLGYAFVSFSAQPVSVSRLNFHIPADFKAQSPPADQTPGAYGLEDASSLSWGRRGVDLVASRLRTREPAADLAERLRNDIELEGHELGPLGEFPNSEVARWSWVSRVDGKQHVWLVVDAGGSRYLLTWALDITLTSSRERAFNGMSYSLTMRTLSLASGAASDEPAEPNEAAEEASRGGEHLGADSGQTYIGFHEELRASGSDARPDLVKRWHAEGFDAVEGAWIDLIESLGALPTSPELDALVLAETERMNPPPADVVRVLPQASRAVRAGLLRRLQGLTSAEVADYREQLADAEDIDHPAIMEAYLRLGVITAHRVGRLVQAQGLDWTREETMAALLRQRAEEKPAFVHALLRSGTAQARVLGCELVRAVPAAGDETLSKLLPLLRDDSPRVVRAAAAALQELGNPRAAWALARALGREADADLRRDLLTALGALDPAPTLKLIQRLQRKQSPSDQHAAACALQAFPLPEAAGPLEVALASTDATVVEAALRSLEALLETLSPSDLAGCRDAVTALKAEGEHAELRARVLAALE